MVGVTVRLVLDTTGHGGAVVLAEDAAIRAEAIHDAAQGYAEHLFGLLDDVLGRAGLDRDAVDELCVVGGPGSFTGLRIGVMTAKVLAAVLDRPLRAAGTLPLIASSATGPGVAVANAGGGCVWRLDFDDPAAAGGTTVRRTGIEDLPRDTTFLASDAKVVQVLIESGRHAEQTASLARLLAAAAHAGHPAVRTVDPDAYVPDYVSPSQAERVHGVDMTDELARPIRPRGWD